MERTGGQRTWTAMVFLNVPGDGGETCFPGVGVKVTPRLGNLLIWNNMDSIRLAQWRLAASGNARPRRHQICHHQMVSRAPLELRRDHHLLTRREGDCRRLRTVLWQLHTSRGISDS